MKNAKLDYISLRDDLFSKLFDPSRLGDGNQIEPLEGSLTGLIKDSFLKNKADVFAERAEYISGGRNNYVPLLSTAVVEISTLDILQALYDLTWNFTAFLGRAPTYAYGASFTKEMEEFGGGADLARLDGDLKSYAAARFTDVWGERFYETLPSIEVFWVSDKLHMDFKKKFAQEQDEYWSQFSGTEAALARMGSSQGLAALEHELRTRDINGAVRRRNPSPLQKNLLVSQLNSPAELLDYLRANVGEFESAFDYEITSAYVEDSLETLYTALRYISDLRLIAYKKAASAKSFLNTSGLRQKTADRRRSDPRWAEAELEQNLYNENKINIYKSVEDLILQKIKLLEPRVTPAIDLLDYEPVEANLATLESPIFKKLGRVDLNPSMQEVDRAYYNVDPLFTVFVGCGLIEFMARQFSGVYTKPTDLDIWRLNDAKGITKTIGNAFSQTKKTDTFEIKASAYGPYSDESDVENQGVFLKHGKRLQFVAKAPDYMKRKTLPILVDSQGYLVPSFATLIDELNTQRISMNLQTNEVQGYKTALPTYYSRNDILRVFDRVYNISANERNHLLLEGATVSAVPAIYSRVQLFKSLRKLLEDITEIEASFRESGEASSITYTIDDCPVWLHLVYSFLGTSPTVKIVPSSLKGSAIVYQRINPSKTL